MTATITHLPARAPLKLICGKCAHEWDSALILPAPIMQVASWMQACRCPLCGADSSHQLLRKAVKASQDLDIVRPA